MSIEQKKVPVLVVGAGPSGLMAACQLALHEIPFRIIDKNTTPTTQSRALGIHARTLEIFNQMGIVDKFLALGKPCHGISWFFKGKEAASIVIKGDDLTEFPYILSLAQSKTEQILSEYLTKLGCKVERGIELVDYSFEGEGDFQTISAKLKKGDGSEEIFEAKYLIGADGAHSTVREKIGLHLEGETYPQNLFVIDCELDVPSLAGDKMSFMLSEKGLIGIFPMIKSHENEPNKLYRVVGILPADYKADSITFEEIQKDFSERIGMPGTICNPTWTSIYHAHHRHAKVFQEGNCFIIGDAAHIHSPLGGQGMNTGLQDAYNLIWKLALVYKGKAQNSLLDTYSTERVSVAEKLVKTTDKLFYVIAGESTLVKNFRLHALPVVLRLGSLLMQSVKALEQINFKILSQIGISYPHSVLSQKASWGKFPKDTPEPGDRLPAVFYTEGEQQRNIQEYAKGTKFHWLVFSKNNHEIGKELKEMLRSTSYDKVIEINYVPYLPETEDLYKKFGIQQEGYYLVRPDMYIACRSSSVDKDMINFKPYMQQFLKSS